MAKRKELTPEEGLINIKKSLDDEIRRAENMVEGFKKKLIRLKKEREELEVKRTDEMKDREV